MAVPPVEGSLLPAPHAPVEWLRHYAQHFQTVEVNNVFYRLPEADTFTRWRESTPDDFVIGVKASRYLTHVRRLRDPAEPVERLMCRAQHLGDKLGPVLLQLPPDFPADLPALPSDAGGVPPDGARRRSSPGTSPGTPTPSLSSWRSSAPPSA